MSLIDGTTPSKTTTDTIAALYDPPRWHAVKMSEDLIKANIDSLQERVRQLDSVKHADTVVFINKAVNELILVLKAAAEKEEKEKAAADLKKEKAAKAAEKKAQKPAKKTPAKKKLLPSATPVPEAPTVPETQGQQLGKK